jgi:hypothetical protein
MRRIPQCPHCQVDLDYYEECDYEYGDTEYIATCTGRCPICEEDYKWEEVYKFEEVKNFRRILDDYNM